MDEKILIENVFDNILKKRSWQEILDTIFEINIRQNGPNMITDIISGLEYAFHIDGMVILNILASNEIDLQSMKLNAKYKNLEIALELLAAKYRIQLILGMELSKNPFGMNGLGFNLEKGTSHTVLNFTRKDGNVFPISCSLQDIINMNISFNNLIKAMLEVGVYTINNQSIDALFLSSDEMKRKMNEIIDRNK